MHSCSRKLSQLAEEPFRLFFPLGFIASAIGVLLTGIWLLGVIASLLGRFLFFRRDVPPPGIPLAVLGLAGAAIAGLVFGLSIQTNDFTRHFLRLLYFQGFLWVAILAFWTWKTRRELRLPTYEQGAIKTRCPQRK